MPRRRGDRRWGSSRPRAKPGWVQHPGPLGRAGAGRGASAVSGEPEVGAGLGQPGPSGGLAVPPAGEPTLPEQGNSPADAFNFPVAFSLGSFLIPTLLCSPRSTPRPSGARCIIKPQPRRGEKHQLKKTNQERKLKTQNHVVETENRLASLNESAPLLYCCPPALVPRGAALRPGPRPSGPLAAESHPRRGSRGSAVGGRAGPGATPGLRRRSREPRGDRCISRERGAPPSGWSPAPGPFRARCAAQALPGPGGLLSFHILGLQTAAACGAAAHCSPGRAAAPLCMCAKTQARGSHQGGASGECVSVCVCVRGCGCAGKAGRPR